MPSWSPWATFLYLSPWQGCLPHLGWGLGPRSCEREGACHFQAVMCPVRGHEHRSRVGGCPISPQPGVRGPGAQPTHRDCAAGERSQPGGLVLTPLTCSSSPPASCPQTDPVASNPGDMTPPPPPPMLPSVPGSGSLQAGRGFSRRLHVQQHVENLKALETGEAGELPFKGRDSKTRAIGK